jgi:hypothetical protein
MVSVLTSPRYAETEGTAVTARGVTQRPRASKRHKGQEATAVLFSISGTVNLTTALRQMMKSISLLDPVHRTSG